MREELERKVLEAAAQWKIATDLVELLDCIDDGQRRSSAIGLRKRKEREAVELLDELVALDLEEGARSKP